MDLMADTKTFKGNLLARQEAGLAPANERETGMDVRAFVVRRSSFYCSVFGSGVQALGA